MHYDIIEIIITIFLFNTIIILVQYFNACCGQENSNAIYNGLKWKVNNRVLGQAPPLINETLIVDGQSTVTWSWIFSLVLK